jgi:hypothetical protein
MSKFYFHKLLCLKHIVLISLLSITSILIVGCTCSKTEEPAVEQKQTIKEEPVGKKEEPVELKPVEKPESVESGKADSTETVKATPTQRPESNEAGSDEVIHVPMKIESHPIPSRENPLEKEYGDVNKEEGAQVEEELGHAKRIV